MLDLCGGQLRYNDILLAFGNLDPQLTEGCFFDISQSLDAHKLLVDLLSADGDAQTLFNGQGWALKNILQLQIRGLEDSALVREQKQFLFEDTNLGVLLPRLFGAKMPVRAVRSGVQVPQLRRFLRIIVEIVGFPALRASVETGCELLGLWFVDQIGHLLTGSLPKLDAVGLTDVIFDQIIVFTL